MSYIIPQKVGWDASKATDLASYNFYWAIPPATLNKTNPMSNPNATNVGKVTEITLPSAVAGFPLIDGNVEVGVAAVDTIGNSSDIASTVLPFGFQPPDPPGPPHLI